MRILVMSDSHGMQDNVMAAIKKAGKFDFLIHCGDICDYPPGIEIAARVPCYMVAGNNDFGTSLKDKIAIDFGGHRIFVAHGHKHDVYSSSFSLIWDAKKYGCDIAIHGHTHIPYIDKDQDILVMNPGSISLPRQSDKKRTFIMLEIDDDTDEVKCSIESID